MQPAALVGARQAGGGVILGKLHTGSVNDPELILDQPRGDVPGVGSRLQHAYDRIIPHALRNSARNDLPGLAADA